MSNSIELAAEVRRLQAEVDRLHAELAAEKARCNELRDRVKSELFAHSILFAAQRRTAAQPEQCSLCVTRVSATAALHQALNNEKGDACRLDVFLPFLVKTFQSAFDGDLVFNLTVEAQHEVDYRRGQSIGLFFAEAAMSALERRAGTIIAGAINVALRDSKRGLELTIDDVGASQEAATLSAGVEARLRLIARDLKGRFVRGTLSDGIRMRLLFPDEV